MLQKMLFTSASNLNDGKFIMKKRLQPILMSACLVSVVGLAHADENQPATLTLPAAKVEAAQGATTAQTVVKNDNVTVISPRTGISYTLGNTANRTIVLQTAAIAPANTITAKRIVAVNPALSTQSQEQAVQALVGGSLVPADATQVAKN